MNRVTDNISSTTRAQRFRMRISSILPIFCIVVILIVFWWLKLTGITMAGEAFCGIDEHIHDTSCNQGVDCTLEEHTHVASCYSNKSADLETKDDWEHTLLGIYPESSFLEKVVAIAESQIGYEESTLNFEVDINGDRRGYTRYGQWYGNPYGDWSTMFTSFCLVYAGGDMPISAGANTLLLAWQDAGLYQSIATHTPVPGEILFLDKNNNGSADATAIVIDKNADILTVIEGDLDNKVAETTYSITSSEVMGYGVSNPKGNIMLLADTQQSSTAIANTISYSSGIFTNSRSFVIYTQKNGVNYAFDGNGNSVVINIDSDGNITTESENSDMILWTVTASGGTNSYLIQNLATGRYMHAYPNNGTGVTTSGAYTSTMIQSGAGVKIRSNTEYAYLDEDAGAFRMTQSQSTAATYYFGYTTKYCIWLDGTNGGLMTYGGSPNLSYTFNGDSVVKLPEEWQTPEKYRYKLQGWYDVINCKYYAPGSEITVSENMVFYADWIAETYDIGVFNAQTSDTVSTSEFITTKIFDYNFLFNVLSVKADVSVTASGHTERWTHMQTGTAPYSNNPTLNYIFRDWDSNGKLSYPASTNTANTSGGVYSGLLTDELTDILFATDNSFDPATGSGIIGKTYLGTGDYLFHLEENPESKYYGYYYYDSSLHAASYNKSEQRFYVYDYLVRTSDSANSNSSERYSDFLPLNSPYRNTNNKNLVTYTYDGVNGEYNGVNHIQYDAKYNTSGSSANNVAANLWFGISMEMEFYLPDTPGTVKENGQSGNRDIYGKEMVYNFSGDDDVWVLVDGEVVLDLGGIHGAEAGEINFSTGIVTINGVQTKMQGIEAGEHVMTVYYLERGGSSSNCSMFFNVAPRFSLTIQKEDVLSQELLNGAEFTIFTDKDCTVPAELWENKEAFDNGEEPTNSFVVVSGMTKLWGLSSGMNYYIKETVPPEEEGYSLASGVICLSMDNKGIASFTVEILPETDELDNPIEPSNGFTVHGFKIDEDLQEVFMIITNAQDWAIEATTVQVIKKWDDTESHSTDYVTVYLTITDPDGTVRRIREIVLGEENQWRYTWTSLPKYYEDGVTEVQYSVEEAYKAGYTSQIQKLDEIIIETFTWAEAYTFTNGWEYILKTSRGCLSSVSAGTNTLKWVDEETAKDSPLALWTATVSGNQVKFINQAGQILSFNYSSSSSNRYYYVTTQSASYQNLVPVESGSGIKFYCTRSNRNYYIGNINSNSYAQASTSSSSGLVFTPMTKITDEITEKVEDLAYEITNTPLENETQLTVYKKWDVGTGDSSLYEQELVTVKLLANGKDTGRTVTLRLKNNWQETFQGLPYADENGDVIVYSIEESWDTEDWYPIYGEVITVDGEIPTYETSVTNVYRWGHGIELPATGGQGLLLWILSGIALVLVSLVGGCILRCRRKKTF